MLIQPSKAIRKQDRLDRDIVRSRKTLSSLNMESLKGILSYFSHLNATGEISDRSYEALVRYACAIFIETEIEDIVQNTLEQKIEQILLGRVLRIDTFF